MTIAKKAIRSAATQLFMPLRDDQDTVIPIVIVAESGATRSYTITVAMLPDTDSSLSTLVLSSVPFTFAPGTFAYSVAVPYATEVATVTATTSSAFATVVSVTAAASAAAENGGGQTLALNSPVRLSAGTTKIKVTVRAASGATSTYAVSVIRPSEDDHDSRLASLVLPFPIAPKFSPAVTSYTCAMPFERDAVSVTAVAASKEATVALLCGADEVRLGESAPLPVGATSFSVNVTAKDRTVTKYALKIVRAAAEDLADLSSLAYSEGSIEPAFAPGCFEYTASASHAVADVFAVATAASKRATLDLALYRKLYISDYAKTNKKKCFFFLL
jgi:hypothetical protein